MAQHKSKLKPLSAISVVFVLLIIITSCSSGKSINPVLPPNVNTSTQSENGLSSFNYPFELSPLSGNRTVAGSKIGIKISNLEYDKSEGFASFKLRLVNSGPILFDVNLVIESMTPQCRLSTFDKEKRVLKYGILVKGVKSSSHDIELSFPSNTNPVIKGSITGNTSPLFRNKRTLFHTDNFATHARDYSSFSGRIIANQVLIRFKNDVSIDRQYEILDEHNLIPGGVNLSNRFIQADILDGRHPDIVVSELKFVGEIDHAEVNAVTTIDFYPDDPAFNPDDPLWEDGMNSWGYRRIQGPEAWDFYNDKTLDQNGDIDTSYGTNAKIIMFILDTGYKYHDEFNIDNEDQQFLNLGINIVNPGNFPNDDHGHGVLVTGIAMAEGNNQLGFAGLAWNTRIVPIKTNDYAGLGDEFRSGIGISYAKEVALDYPDYRCVGNMSYGTHSQNHLVDRVNEASALEDAWAVPNIQFVAAAGNCANNPNPEPGHPCYYNFTLTADNHFPSSFERVIGVGASRGAQSGGLDREAAFSNWGTTIDVAAPGVEIFSCQKDTPQSFKRFSGTSCASPMVSGLFALIWSKNPSLDKSEIKRIIQKTADPMSLPPEKQGKMGTGRINAYKALFASKYLKPNVGEKLSSGDLEGDGLDETVLGLNGSAQNTGLMLVFDSFNREMTNGKLDFGSHNMLTANTFCDLDGDNRDEILIASVFDPGGHFKVMNGTNHLTLKKIEYTWQNFTIADFYDFGPDNTCEHIIACNLDSDNQNEIVAAVQNNPSGYLASTTPTGNLNLYVLDSDGSLLLDFPVGGDCLATDLYAGDIDYDQKDEIVLAYIKNPAGIFAIGDSSNEGDILVLDDSEAGFVEIPNNYTSIPNRIIEQVLVTNLDFDYHDEIVLATLDNPSGYLENVIVQNHASLIALDDAFSGIDPIAWIDYSGSRKTFELTEGNIHPYDDDRFWAWFILNPIGVDYINGAPGGQLLMVPYRMEGGSFVQAGSTASSSNGYRYFSGCIRNGDFDREGERNETALYAVEGGMYKRHRWFEYHDDIGAGLYITWEYRFKPYTNFLEYEFGTGESYEIEPPF